MKILIIASGISPEAGGPTRSCKGLCRSLAQAGEDVTLYVINGHHPFENPCGVKVIYAADTPLFTFTSHLHLYNLVHLQGLWNWQLHKIAVACRRANIPYIISPRGMLDPWALSVKKWKKRIALLVYQRHDLKKAVALHVTAEMERDHVRALGYTQPCIIAPNGVELPVSLPPRKDSANSAVRLRLSTSTPPLNLQPRIAIFLSRLHPGKGLLTLAEAWARVKPQNWIMKVVGPDSYGHKAEVIAKLNSLGIPHCDVKNDQLHCSTSTPNFDSRWEFHDAMNDAEKWTAYRSADLLVHPSVSENFGITIAEGLYAGLPVICTQGTPWQEIEGNIHSSTSTQNFNSSNGRCGWWIEQGVDALADALREATSTSISNLNLLGQRGHALIQEKYTWPAIAKTMIAGYKEILKNVK